MLLPSPDLRIWLYAKPVDMRKQFDGLIVLAKHQLHASPMSGELFVFINRKQTMMKVLYFSRGGYCLWSVSDQYRTVLSDSNKSALDLR
ncbi:hypothetical protein TUM4438_40830 [Shewanella sairae]|uniref:IS66 family insertion sequence element accessory protein TnpB n=2 Tax=Shewanella sairae TaxID=190310 RepID=A0ABQ4PQG2_9GAMM|nr:hypothetical protein TUM4438_40830 [Shewanella sairae]